MSLVPSTQQREDVILRALSPAAKLAAMKALIQQAYDLKAAWIRATEPHLSEDEVRTKARELVTRGQP